jgi:hypothetical protein
VDFHAQSAELLDGRSDEIAPRGVAIRRVGKIARSSRRHEIFRLVRHCVTSILPQARAVVSKTRSTR